MRHRRRQAPKKVIPNTTYPENLINTAQEEENFQGPNLVKSTSSFSHYFHIYYIVNGSLMLLYPLHRLAGL